MRDPREVLMHFTNPAEKEETRLCRVWFVEPWALATDGTFIAGIVMDGDHELPILTDDFPQFGAEAKAYLEQPPSNTSSFATAELHKWAGDYNDKAYTAGDTRVGTVWGFPFDTNRIAKALKYMFAGSKNLDVELCTVDDENVDAADSSVAVTRCTLVIRSAMRVFALARARDIHDGSKELQPIGAMLDEGDDAFDNLLGSL